MSEFSPWSSGSIIVGVKVRFRYQGWGAFVQNQAAYLVVVRKQRE